MEHGGSRSAVRRRRAVQAEDHRRQRHRRRGAGRSSHDPRRFRQPLPRQGHHARRGQHHALLPAASCHPHCRTGDVGADDEVHDGRQDAVPHQHDAQDGLLHVPHDELDQVHACPDGRIPVARHEGGRQLHGGRRRPHLGSGELHRAGMLQNVRGDLLADGERRLDVGMARDEDHHRLAESWASDHRHHRLGRARLLPLYGRARNHDGLHRVLHDGAFDHSVSLLRHDGQVQLPHGEGDRLHVQLRPESLRHRLHRHLLERLSDLAFRRAGEIKRTIARPRAPPASSLGVLPHLPSDEEDSAARIRTHQRLAPAQRQRYDGSIEECRRLGDERRYDGDGHIRQVSGGESRSASCRRRRTARYADTACKKQRDVNKARAKLSRCDRQLPQNKGLHGQLQPQRNSFWQEADG